MAYAVKLERSIPLTLPRHPDAPSDEDFEKWCRREKESGNPLAIDLFSGAGGLGMGVEAAGWVVVAAADHDNAALATHRANFRGLALDVDLSDSRQLAVLIEQLKPLGIDLVVGGPPCQPFSRAGRAKIRSLVKSGVREKFDARKELWHSFIDVVLELKPRAVIMENVPDMAIGDDLLVVRRIANLLENAQYNVDYRLIDAWRYGVPQHRKRFVLQARNDGYAPRWPDPSGTKVTVRDAIADLPPLNGTTGCRELPYTGSPCSELAKTMRRDSTKGVVYDHMTRPVRSDDLEIFKIMKSSTLYSELPEYMRRYRSDTFNDKYKRLSWDDLSRTITAHIAKDGYWYIHPSEHRTLTVREAARIQTFPDSFRFSGTRSDAFRQIGNAVPPLLSQAIAETAKPSQGNRRIGVSVTTLRPLLTSWARDRRRVEWWLYPGPDMTRACAAFAAIMNVHRLSHQDARALMEPFRAAPRLTVEMMRSVKTQNLSAVRRDSVYRIRGLVRENGSADAIFRIESLMGAMQRRVFSLLKGNNELVVNSHVGKVVAILLNLPEEYTKVHANTKLALAQIVSLGRGDDPALRMCAIRMLSLSEAKALSFDNLTTEISQISGKEIIL